MLSTDTSTRALLFCALAASAFSAPASAASHHPRHVVSGAHRHHARSFQLSEGQTVGDIQTGRASYYSGGSRHTAGGGFVGAATCAHRTLPFGTKILVTNLANALQTVLTVNDRGPFVRGRIVDVSRGAAGVLGMLHAGTASVRVEVLGGPG